MKASIYRSRRLKMLTKMLPSSALLLQSLGSSDSLHSLANKDLFYLSGFSEQQAALLLLKGKKKQQILFCLTKDKTRSLWQGPSLGAKAAKEKLGFDKSYALDDLQAYLESCLQDIEVLYLPLSNEKSQPILDLIRRIRTSHSRRGKQFPSHFIDSAEIIGDMRLIKSTAEISYIKEAARISVGAHNRVAAKLPQLRHEYEVEAELIHYYRSHAAHCAFPPIVAAGANSCILHYMSNDCPIRDWVLVDSGAQYNYYAADLTRTYASCQLENSYFDKIHQATAKVLALVYRTVRLGLPFIKLHQTSCRALTKELIRLNIIKVTLSQALAAKSYKKYFPHLTSHWIGLDVHDVGSYENKYLKAGMVFSLEPGLYFAPDDQTVAPQWRGIGVRLEDTVLMTRRGAQNLTAAACHNRLL